MLERLFFAALAVPCLASCSVDEITINPPDPTPTPPPAGQPPPVTPSLPRLAAGPHLGMITGFDPLDPARAATAAERYAEARAAGATIGRIQIDWAELETAQGVYDEQALIDAFADPGLEGMNLVVLLSTLDSEGLTVPAYLGDSEGLSNDLTLASDEVVTAFGNLLDWLGPQLHARDVWLLSIANEPQGPIEDGVVAEENAVVFYSAAMDRWNEAVPEIGITATFTTGAPQGIPQFFEAVRERADIVSFNYYCLTADIFVTGEAAWQARLAEMKSNAGDREIFLQELGCPVGYSPQGGATAIGGTLANQTRFFEFFGDQFATDPQLRAATLFQLYDWSPGLAASFSEPLNDAGMPEVGDRLEEWLATVGLVRWSDRANRPAWQTWLAQLERVRTARGQ